MYTSIIGTFLRKEKELKKMTTDIEFERGFLQTNLQFYLLICLSNMHRWWETCEKIMDKLARGEVLL